ncbi:MAG: PD-(D/E)XK motif protein [Pirellulales bacterium]|nr:PD-(D/E)XK motif protein [Pirellulales bacterium]
MSIDDGTSQREVRVSLLECLAQDDATIKLFVRTIASVLEDEDSPIGPQSVVELVERLLDLFRDYSLAGDAEILGLWAELLLIAHSPNPADLARHWRSHSGSRYDFGSDTERIDVKATTSALRHHELNYNQAVPPAGVAAAFVSIMTEQVSQGTSVGLLWDRVLDLAPTSQARIDRLCIQALGRDWQIARDTSYDLAKALSTLAVYPADAVPHLSFLPPGVIRARFVSDFAMGKTWQGKAPTPGGLIDLALSCVTSSGR